MPTIHFVDLSKVTREKYRSLMHNRIKQDGYIAVFAMSVSEETLRWARENKIDVVKCEEKPCMLGESVMHTYGFGYDRQEEYAAEPVIFWPTEKSVNFPQQFCDALSNSGPMNLEEIFDGYTVVQAPELLF